MILLIDILLGLAGFYLIAGVIFSIYFYWKGAAIVDAGTNDTPWHFKLIIFPGVILLWFFLFLRIIKKS